MEKTTHSLFVLKCAPYTSITGVQVYYYYCNRAGIYKTEGEGKRQLKSQGSSKMGCQCSAYMKATHNTITQQVSVVYCDTHYNHSTQLAFLKIPLKVRLVIASKLRQGVSMERILDDIRDSVHNSVDREHLLTRQDLHNTV